MLQTDDGTVTINFYDEISPDYYDLHEQIAAGDTDDKGHVLLDGGRGSLKSSYVSLEIIDGIMLDPRANAAVFRKVGDTMGDSVYEQYQWAVTKLGVDGLWRFTKSPMRAIYTDPTTGYEQYIIFKGADRPRKIKSFKFSRGYLKFAHYEEADEFDGEDDFDIINKSLRRGTPKGVTPIIFYSWNPPRHRGHWIRTWRTNMLRRPDVYALHTDYRTVRDTHPDWLGDAFLRDAEIEREFNPRRYKHSYLGQDVATGLEVFDNIEVRRLSDDEIANMEDKRESGLDFGFGADPLVYLDACYDRKHDTVYLWNELWLLAAKNRVAVAAIMKQNPKTYKNGAKGREIMADSAEPRTISEFNDLGITVWGAKKGAGSIDHGIKWLQDRRKIVIDDRCTNAVREFEAYHLVQDKHGNTKSGYPDKDNHTIDTARYALNYTIREWS